MVIEPPTATSAGSIDTARTRAGEFDPYPSTSTLRAHPGRSGTPELGGVEDVQYRRRTRHRTRPADASFVWCGGQGGYGIHKAPAAAMATAGVALGAALRADLEDVGLTPNALLADRLR
jgi:hypothetical protein